MVLINKKNILLKGQSRIRKTNSMCAGVVHICAIGIGVTYFMLRMHSQVFNSMNHNFFVAKLSYYGFNERSVEWVRLYLKELRLWLLLPGN